MQVKSIAECPKGILQYVRPSLSYHLSLKSFLVYLEWPLKTGKPYTCSVKLYAHAYLCTCRYAPGFDTVLLLNVGVSYWNIPLTLHAVFSSSCFCCRPLICFNINFAKNILAKNYQSVKSNGLDPDQDRHSVKLFAKVFRR